MNTYVIMAGGKGERLWPVTESVSKAMVRVLEKPLLEWIVEGIWNDAGKIVLVVGKNRDEVKNHFDKTKYEPLGTGHAILQAEQFVENNFVTINGDNFFGPEIFPIMAKAARGNNFFAVGKKVGDCRQYGVFREKAGKVAGIEEKPQKAGPGLANLNLFFLPKFFFSYLKKLKKSERGEYELPAAAEQFAKDHGLKLVAHDGYWTDVGFFWNHLDASAYAVENLAKNEKRAKVEKGAAIIGKVSIGKGTIVKTGSRIEGPAWIGENCVIGPNAFIRKGTAIESGCFIGSSEVKNSVIMRGSKVPHFSYVGDSVICEDVNFGAGSKVANLRFDSGPIKAELPGRGAFESGKNKLGCAVGKGTRIGINAGINCGTLIGSKCRVLPCSFVAKNMDSGTTNSYEK